jgi:plastocyanin
MKQINYLILMMFIISSSTVAADLPVYELKIKEHRFDPPLLEIPSGTKVKLVVKNLDASPEEFESYKLNREKVVAGNSEITVYIGPLEPGEYGFFGEFHQDTAQGKLTVK